MTSESTVFRCIWYGIVLASAIELAGCGPSRMQQGHSFALLCPGGRIIKARLVAEGDQVLLQDRARLLVLPRTAEGVYDDRRVALRFEHDGRAVLGLNTGRAQAVVCHALPNR